VNVPLGAALFVLIVVGGCRGDDRPDSADSTVVAPTVTRSPASTVPGRQPQGFTTVSLELTGTEPCCVWLADSPGERSRGLMEVTDIGAPVGMLFVYTAEQSTNFYMFNTILPLSIAFFDGDGRFVSSTDMEPCALPDPGDCPRYGAEAPFRYALEVPEGRLDELGIGPETTITPGTEAEGCPAA